MSTTFWVAPELRKEEIPPDDALPDSDEEILETPWHRYEINLLNESVDCHRAPRTDYYVGGNMFIYYSSKQWDPELRGRPELRGPDFFFVDEVDGTKERRKWMVWREDERYPDAIVELLSESTKTIDLTSKKNIYEQVFKTAEYFCYDPDEEKFYAWRLKGGKYRAMKPNDQGFYWSERLALWLGKWSGSYIRKNAVWLRFYDKDFQLVPTFAEKEKRLAELETKRADALEAEVARLRKLVTGTEKARRKQNGKNGKNGK